jgi:hypothetical protein
VQSSATPSRTMTVPSRSGTSCGPSLSPGSSGDSGCSASAVLPGFTMIGPFGAMVAAVILTTQERAREGLRSLLGQVRRGDRACALASNNRGGYTAIKPLQASGESVHHGDSVRSKDSSLPHHRPAAGGL